MDNKKIIEKWYKALEFDKKCDEQFYQNLKKINIDDDTNIDNYDFNSLNGEKNLLAYLYMCESLSVMYEQKGIDKDILIDTIMDIKRWCYTWSRIKGRLYLGEIEWLSNHLGFKLFKLGRLQFQIDEAKEDIDKLNIKKGDNIIAVHIPEDGALTPFECNNSFKRANEFLLKYFPKVSYEYFYCHSWLLDDTLKEFLLNDSNIITFGNMFDKISYKESDDIIKYIFGWDKKREDVKSFEAKSGFANSIKNSIIKDKKFYIVCGYKKK